ncbi:MAG: DUF1926 domain-containing protein [Candidatus Dormibacteraceae bacterium]
MKRLDLALALHNHQPVGNFGWVLEDMYRDSYLPLVESLERHPRASVALHYSGFLLDWLSDHHPELLARVRLLVDRGQVEILGGGYYEPILPSIPDRDKAAQLERLRDAVERIFGRPPTGLWLAERVWEAALARPLAEAGYQYTILDDSHFGRVGIPESETLVPFLTEDQGHRLTLLATNRSLRYLVPWRDVEEVIAELSGMASEEPRIALMGDDGEKLGGWPGTARLCWKEGWVDRFFDAIEANGDWLQLVLPGPYVAGHRAYGPVYLPAGSYPEMLKWSSGYWRNFLHRYPEVNAMHKKMLRVSEKVAGAGAAGAAALPDLLRGQANDAYWHGVFGGIYLPHLRRSIWRSLLTAERAVTPVADGLRTEITDYDLDGSPEVLLESHGHNLYVAPGLGAAVVEWDAADRNVAGCLARRAEPYHSRLLAEGGSGGGVTTGDEPLRVKEPGLEKRLFYDSRRRLLFQAYLTPRGATLGQARGGRLPEIGSFSIGEFSFEVATPRVRMKRCETVTSGRHSIQVEMDKDIELATDRTQIELVLQLRGPGLSALLIVECNIDLPGGANDGDVGGRRLDRPADLGPLRSVVVRQPGAGSRLSLSGPPGGRVWYYPVETVNNSESGYERIVQGACLAWVQPVQPGAGVLRFRYRMREGSD